MIYRYLLFCVLPLIYCSCPDQLIGTPPPPANQRIQPSVEYPNYWSWDGKTPILLLGAGGATNAYLETDYPQKLNILESNRGNFVAINVPLTINEQQRDSLVEFVRLAEEKAIVVEVTILTPGQGPASSRSDLQQSFRGLVDEIATFRNVLYKLEIPDSEPFLEILELHHPTAPVVNINDKDAISGWKQLRGAAHWQQLQDTFSRYPSDHPFHTTDIVNFNETAAEGIAAFNRSVMAGAAAVRQRPRPQGDGFSGPALASIRAIRTIENHFNFWELETAPEITPTAAPNKAYPMTDGNNGYLIYLPTAGSVHLQLLDLEEQIPLRVLVIGYLGTQKSELLKPPYDNHFTLYTEEPRGGWMVIKPER